MSCYLAAAETIPDLLDDSVPQSVPGETSLALWADDFAVIHGQPADIRALLRRALDLIPEEGP